jgi:excisionase family DNA binding protein
MLKIMLLTVKDLSRQLQIKPTTLYAWASEGKIPSLKIHGALRFEVDAIEAWLEKCAVRRPPEPFQFAHNNSSDSVETLIARAKHAVYTSRLGKPDPQRAQEEGRT